MEQAGLGRIVGEVEPMQRITAYARISAIFLVQSMLCGAELRENRLFFLNFGENAESEFRQSKSVEIPGIFAGNPRMNLAGYDYFTSAEPAKLSSPVAVRLLEDMRCGGMNAAFSVMPLGKTDQAAQFEAKNRVPQKSGAITFWFRGQAFDYTPTADKTKDIPKRRNFRTWDVSTALRETFFEFRGPGGRVTFGKLEPAKLVLEADGAKLSLDINFDVSLAHLIAINYTDGHAQIFVNGILKAEGALMMPADIKEIIVGHIGPGSDVWNRWLDDFAVWKRPLKISEIMILRRTEGMIQLPLQTTIPKIADAPTIDGLMKEGEWDQSAVLTGMQSIKIQGGYSAYAQGGDLSDLKDRIFLCYNDKNLYVGYHCLPPREITGNAAMIAAMLKRGISVFDANVDFDDAFQICLQYPKPGGDLYNLFVNALNTHYDFQYTGYAEGGRLPGMPGECKLGWDPKWQSASTLDLDGWHLEIAIPFDSFEMPAPKPGDVWHVNFMRWWRTIRSGTKSWAWGNRTSDEEGNERASAPAGRMIFGAPGVVVRQNTIGELAQGQADISADLVNTDTKERAVACLIESNSRELADEKRFTIPAGGKATYRFKSKIINELTANLILKVLDENKKPIALAGYPVQRPTEAEIYVRKYPSFNLVKYEINFSDLAKYEAGTLSLDVAVRNEKGKEVYRKKFDRFRDYHLVAEINTKNLPLGAYTVHLVFKGPGGKELEKATQTFEKQALPEWHGNKLGYDEGWAPHPWTNIEVKDDRSVHVWGRTYDFADTLYPSKVLTQGKSVLRAPMGISLETSEGKLAANAKVTGAEWTKKTECRVEGVRKAALGLLAVENHFWIEYDGLVWTTLKLIPSGAVRVKSLAFEIPFTREFSDVINANDYSMRHTGKFKPEGYVGSAHATWLGNAYGGIQWDIETVGPFEVRDPNACVRVINAPEGGVMRIEIINKDTDLSRPREISFGFIATPARPRTLRTTSGTRFRRYLNALGRWQDPEPAWAPFHQHWLNPVAAQRGRISPEFPGVEQRPVHQTTLAMMAGSDEAMQQFGDEWLNNENDRWRNISEAKQRTSVTTNSRSLVDYIVWRFNEYFKREPMAGGYFDVSLPEFSANPYAGAGYVRADGTREPQLNLLGHRMVAKRIFNIQKAVFPGGGLWWHASEGPRLIYMSYCIGDYDGENGNSIINGDNPTYRTLLTPDAYRAQYMGHNWGHWNAFLSQGRIQKETLEKYGFAEMWDQWTGLQWLHDCFVYTGWFSKVGHLEPLLTQRDMVPLNQYHMFSPFNRFLGYWEQSITRTDKPEFYASFYIKDSLKPVPHYGMGALPFYSNYDTGLDGLHQAALVFYNHGMYEGEVRLAIDWKKLGFDVVSQVKAINAVHPTGFRVLDWSKPIPELAGELYDKSATEYARIENGKLVFPITQYNYRLIILQAPKPWVGLKEIKPTKQVP